MKRLSIVLFSVAVALSGFFTSCTEDTATTPPVVTFTNNVETATVTEGDDWTITGNITSESGLKQVKYFKAVGNTETQFGSTVSSFDDKNNFNFTVNVTDITETMSVKITAIDKDDQEVSKSFTITVNAAGGQINSYTAKLVGAQDATAGSFFASVTGTVYKTAELTTENRPKVDITYGIHSGSPKVISATARQSLGFAAFTGGTETKYVSSNIDFAAVSNDTNLKTIDFANATTSIVVENGKVYAFKNAAGKIGLFKVVSYTAGTTGNITIDVKVQQ